MSRTALDQLGEVLGHQWQVDLADDFATVLLDDRLGDLEAAAGPHVVGAEEQDSGTELLLEHRDEGADLLCGHRTEREVRRETLPALVGLGVEEQLPVVLHDRLGGGVVGVGSDRPHHQIDLVALHQLAGLVHGGGHVGLDVLGGHLDLATVDATIRVDLVDRQPGAAVERGAVGGEGPGEVGDDPDRDRVCLFAGSTPTRRHRHRHRHDHRDQPPHSHMTASFSLGTHLVQPSFGIHLPGVWNAGSTAARRPVSPYHVVTTTFLSV